MKIQSLKDAAIEPDELFNQTWSLIKSSYFDDDMNVSKNWAKGGKNATAIKLKPKKMLTLP